MNVLFVYSIFDIQSFQRPLQAYSQMQFGISYISSVLRKAGCSTSLAVISRASGMKNNVLLEDIIKKFRPQLICFSAVTTEFAFNKEIAAWLKSRYPGIFILVGGNHVTLNPDDAFPGPFDAACIGEGEYPTLELVRAIGRRADITGIANLWVKTPDGIVKNPPRPFLENLNELPFPDRDIWSAWVDEQPGNYIPILLGRGCPYNCTYCCNHALRRVATGAYVRFRSPENIISELENICAKDTVHSDFYLEVETIAANPKWAIGLCGQLASFNKTVARPVTYRVNMRVHPNLDYEALFGAFVRANISHVNIGLESGCERIRTEVLDRHYSNEDIVNATNCARRHGLKFSLLNMIGIPGETAADFQETIRMNRLCFPDSCELQIFYPYPGTALHALAVREKLIPSNPDTTMERTRAVLNLPTFSKELIEKYYIWFGYYVYRGQKSILKILAMVFARKIKSYPQIHAMYRKFTSSGYLRLLKHKLKS